MPSLFSFECVVFISIFGIIITTAEPLLQFTNDCQAGMTGFKIHTKKSLKMPLNGDNLKITFDKSFFKDYCKKSQCLIIDKEIKEIMTNFKNDVPQGKKVSYLLISQNDEAIVISGETMITYKNNSKLMVTLDESGNPVGILRYFMPESKQVSVLGHSQFPLDHWTFHTSFWNYSRWIIDDTFQLISNEKFNQFYACKHLDSKRLLAINCLEVGHHLAVFEDAFHYLHNQYLTEEFKSYLDIDLFKWISYPHDNEKQARLQVCQDNSLKNWYKTIANQFKASEFRMTDADLDTSDFLTSFQDIHEITIDLSEFSKFPKGSIPTIVILTQGHNTLFSGNFRIDENFQAIISRLPNGVTLEKSTIRLDFHHDSDIFMMTGPIMPSLTIVGHLCKSGKLCGRVMKYGMKLRDTLCNCTSFNKNHRLSYLGYHDSQTGEPIGPTFNFLLGSSILYSETGSFPSENVAYIYFGGQTAIHGSFDKHRLLIKGQKVPFEKVGCNQHGLPILKFLHPMDPQVFYHYKPPTTTEFGDQPTVPDEVATEFTYVKKINNVLGDGLFAKKDIEDNTLIALYGGYRGSREELDQTRIHGNPYGHRVGFCPDITVNIPQGHGDILAYNATMAHKCNNQFESNLATTYVDSVRNGLIGAFVTKRKIEKNEELTSFYGYNQKAGLVHKWYLDQLEEHVKEHPEFNLEQRIKQKKEENENILV